MEELATCECGNQSFEIYHFRVECCKCRKKYNISLMDPTSIIMGSINNKSNSDTPGIRNL